MNLLLPKELSGNLYKIKIKLRGISKNLHFQKLMATPEIFTQNDQLVELTPDKMALVILHVITYIF